MTLSIPATQTGPGHHISSTATKEDGSWVESHPLVDLTVLSKPTLQVELPLQGFVALVCFVKRDDLATVAEPSSLGPTANIDMLEEPR